MLTTNQTWWSRWTVRWHGQNDGAVPEVAPDVSSMEAIERAPAAPLAAPDRASIVESMLAQGRYALLLRRQVVESLSAEQFQRAREALERSMATVPGGVVDIGLRNYEGDAVAEALEQVEPLLLDRYPVTNRQFRQFVEAGGYALEPLWDADIWPTRAELVDSGGAPGPRFWRSGRYPSGEDDYPVVGINWHEAAAYARWAGKRLPDEAEWLKAAAWPIRTGDGQHSQRRFPWGDTIDRGRCNVWGSGPGRTAAVTQFSAGVSVGGVYQLTGNVWEWMNGDFEAFDADGAPLELTIPMKGLRGGAFDTYFEHQASCQSPSGETPLARKHNIGFRCALSACDVALPGATP
ncbi:MAG TPA: formylglycine-generating enzyme family protein [Pirellulales bacterium]|nr:formylglycine-generating enzyme family protein [Pirellulales bacterium]